MECLNENTENSRGPTVGAAEPHKPNNRPKTYNTRRIGKAQECRIWPDVKPSERADKTGLKHGRITVFGPGCQVRISNGGWIWMWLGVCECGGEIIYRNVHQTQSCGCLARERSAEALAKLKKHRDAVRAGTWKKKNDDPATGTNEFERLKICTTPDSNHFLCNHYHECQWHIIDNKEFPARYQANPGRCFAKSDEQLGYEAADKWRIKQ